MKKLTVKEVREQGEVDGAEEVDEALREYGIEALQPGVLGWDEGAINAGVFEIVFGRGHSHKLRLAYYEGYDLGSRRRAKAILARKMR